MCGPASIPFPLGARLPVGVGILVGFLAVHFTALTLPSCCRSALSGGSGARMPTCPQVEITAAAPSSVGDVFISGFRTLLCSLLGHLECLTLRDSLSQINIEERVGII